jgi:hypothetical protein
MVLEVLNANNIILKIFSQKDKEIANLAKYF